MQKPFDDELFARMNRAPDRAACTPDLDCYDIPVQGPFDDAVLMISSCRCRFDDAVPIGVKRASDGAILLNPEDGYAIGVSHFP